LLARLAVVIKGSTDSGVHYRQTDSTNENGKLAFVFPGQGSQYPGKMAAVSMGARELAPLLASLPGVVLANQNSPVQTVISGPSAEVDTALLLLRQHSIGAKEIATACAFHSPVVAGAEAAFADILSGISFGSTAWPVYANVTAEPYSGSPEKMRELLSLHVVSPVRFIEDIEQMYADGARVFVEVGPKRVLAGCIRKILAGKPHTVITLDDGNSSNLGGLTSFLSALAALAVRVPALDSSLLFKGRNAAVVNLAEARHMARTA